MKSICRKGDIVTAVAFMAALALIVPGTVGSSCARTPTVVAGGNADLSVMVQPVQESILKGMPSSFAVALTLTAAALPVLDSEQQGATDLVIVLDRSGSMQGLKIDDARRAVVGLLQRLGPEDRLALVTYANGVEILAPLMAVHSANRRQLTSLVSRIRSGGGTNLGAGLRCGMDLLACTPTVGRQRKVILISDGLANQGVTDPAALEQMAAAAVEYQFSISTVGVGLNFNELLMTAIADQGAGHYYFLEDPRIFARVFEAELLAMRRVAAADVEIRIELEPGVQLNSAGGYPLRREENIALIYPGNLMSDCRRQFYLNFSLPPTADGMLDIARFEVRYHYEGRMRTICLAPTLQIACVDDPAEVMAGIQKDVWTRQVIQEDFSRLKNGIADDIREGNPERAKFRIQAYKERQSAVNAVVGSDDVARNLEVDVVALEDQVAETFAGAPAAVAEKQKRASKSLQHESYQRRRGKQPLLNP